MSKDVPRTLEHPQDICGTKVATRAAVCRRVHETSSKTESRTRLMVRLSVLEWMARVALLVAEVFGAPTGIQYLVEEREAMPDGVVWHAMPLEGNQEPHSECLARRTGLTKLPQGFSADGPGEVLQFEELLIGFFGLLELALGNGTDNSRKISGTPKK